MVGPNTPERPLIETSYGALYSGMRQVTSPDGMPFDILRGAPERAVAVRGRGLTTMREMVRESAEPEVLSYLNGRLSAEYMMSSAVIHAKDPALRNQLARVYVATWLDEGQRAAAVDAVFYARQAGANLEDVFGDEFFTDQYEGATREGNYRDAWNIAYKVLSYEPAQEEPGLPSPWRERENESFNRHAENALKRNQEDPSLDTYIDLDHVFQMYRFREDGYEGFEVSDLAQRVARRVVDQNVAMNRGHIALLLARESHLPPEELDALKKKVDPSAIDRARQLWNNIRQKAAHVIRK